MEQKNVIMIDEESFRTKAFEVIDKLVDDGAIAVGLTAAIVFPLLQRRLFYPQEAPKETEQE